MNEGYVIDREIFYERKTKNYFSRSLT
jgi:hypothetical protein